MVQTMVAHRRRADRDAFGARLPAGRRRAARQDAARPQREPPRGRRARARRRCRAGRKGATRRDSRAQRLDFVRPRCANSAHGRSRHAAAPRADVHPVLALGRGQDHDRARLLLEDDARDLRCRSRSPPGRCGPGEVDGRDYHFVDQAEFDRDGRGRRVLRMGRGVRPLLRHPQGADPRRGSSAGRTSCSTSTGRAPSSSTSAPRATSCACSCCRRASPSSSRGCAAAGPTATR